MFLVLHLQMPASFYPKGEVRCVYIKILLEKKKTEGRKEWEKEAGGEVVWLSDKQHTNAYRMPYLNPDDDTKSSRY